MRLHAVRVIAGTIITLVGWTSLSCLAQVSPATLPDLQLSIIGTVNAVTVQEDGKIVIGGIFTQVNGKRRSNIARINPDGTLDLTWDPNANDAVQVLAAYGTNIFIGGEFTSIGGVA